MRVVTQICFDSRGVVLMKSSVIIITVLHRRLSLTGKTKTTVCPSLLTTVAENTLIRAKLHTTKNAIGEEKERERERGSEKER